MKLDQLRLWRSPTTGVIYAGYVRVENGREVATSKVDVTEQYASERMDALRREREQDEQEAHRTRSRR